MPSCSSGCGGPAYRDSTNYLHVYIGRLRRRLSKAKDLEITTELGVGYMLRLAD